ncbi:hypothetical protein A5N15_03500 [Rothia kristinae]|uniref:LamB/YcsF family protein n=1 Tax=Rothia kristinae TaxID=37923 RepID=A0A657IX61_9MICC|nr:hypothetical protein A5N15_03500 [Rothia kristinae]
MTGVGHRGPGAAPRIDLNSDSGESFGSWTMGDDAAMAGLASSLNVACGFHAGDPSVARATCRAPSSTEPRSGRTWPTRICRASADAAWRWPITSWWMR